MIWDIGSRITEARFSRGLWSWCSLAMFCVALVFSSQQQEAEPENVVNESYVGSWYHVEYGKSYVLTLNDDGTARTTTRPLSSL